MEYGIDCYRAEQERVLRDKLGDPVYEWLDKKDKERKMDAEKWLASYGRLFSFLRVVPVMRGEDFFCYIRPERYPDEYLDPDAPWLIERCPEDLRLIDAGSGAPRALLWMPRDTRFRKPTLQEFYSAYGPDLNIREYARGVAYGTA